MQFSLLDQSLLIALLLTALTRSLQLSSILDSTLETTEAEPIIETNIFAITIDLLGWLQLDHLIVLAAIMYLCRFKDLESFPVGQNVWHQLIVAVKLAQNLFDDEPFDFRTWKQAAQGC